MMNSLDEAIKHCEEVAEKYCEKVDDEYSDNDTKALLVKVCDSIERKVKKIWE